MREGEGGSGAGSIVLPTGDRFTLSESIITIGRHPESNLVLADPNVSRNHAEIRPQGDRYAVVHLGSTTGTKVNGLWVNTQVLEIESASCREYVCQYVANSVAGVILQ